MVKEGLYSRRNGVTYLFTSLGIKHEEGWTHRELGCGCWLRLKGTAVKATEGCGGHGQ